MSKHIIIILQVFSLISVHKTIKIFMAHKRRRINTEKPLNIIMRFNDLNHFLDDSNNISLLAYPYIQT